MPIVRPRKTCFSRLSWVKYPSVIRTIALYNFDVSFTEVLWPNVSIRAASDPLKISLVTVVKDEVPGKPLCFIFFQFVGVNKPVNLVSIFVDSFYVLPPPNHNMFIFSFIFHKYKNIIAMSIPQVSWVSIFKCFSNSKIKYLRITLLNTTNNFCLKRFTPQS